MDVYCSHLGHPNLSFQSAESVVSLSHLQQGWESLVTQGKRLVNNRTAMLRDKTLPALLENRPHTSWTKLKNQNLDLGRRHHHRRGD